MTTVESLEYDDLVERLMRGASGLFINEAAVRLIARHGFWLRDTEFHRFVELFDSGDAGIHFADAVEALDRGDLRGDQESSNILRIAASLATFYRVSFRDVCERIRPENLEHVAEAIMYANGFRDSVATAIARR